MVVKRFAVGLALVAIVAGCSSSTPQMAEPTAPPAASSPPPQAATIALAAEPATFIYGSGTYTFAVPAALDQSSTGVTAGAVPGGIIWMTPPGFPDAAAHPITKWSLWFTPSSLTGGSLWTGAQQWQIFTKGQAPRLLRMTGGYAIISLTEGTQTQTVGVRLTDGSLVMKIPLVDKPNYPPVPAGYKWIGTSQARPEIAVPDNWIVQPIRGGSSNGVSATNPEDPNVKVMLIDSGCAGCYQPNVTSRQMYDSFSSPMMGAAKGENYTWLNEQTVAFTLPPDDQNPYPTYGVTRTFVERSGNREAKVSIPETDRQTATIILNSMLSRP